MFCSNFKVLFCVLSNRKVSKVNFQFCVSVVLYLKLIGQELLKVGIVYVNNCCLDFYELDFRVSWFFQLLIFRCCIWWQGQSDSDLVVDELDLFFCYYRYLIENGIIVVEKEVFYFIDFQSWLDKLKWCLCVQNNILKRSCYSQENMQEVDFGMI